MNPNTLPDQNSNAYTIIEYFVSTRASSFGVINISDAYPSKVKRVRQGILLQNKERVIEHDEIVADRLIKDLYWFMRTPAAIKISDYGKTAMLIIDQEYLNVQIVSPAGANFEILSVKLFAASAQLAGGDDNEGIKRLAIYLKQTAELVPFDQWK